MFVTEHLERAKNPLYSYEIIPPARGQSARDILNIVEELLPFEPPFIDVTSHSAEAVYDELDDGTITRRIRKKRPGTISICGIIQNRYNIDTVPHLLCRGFTKEETEDAMIELNYLGIHNALAIRGDETNYRPEMTNGNQANAYACELVTQLNALKQAQYLEDLADSKPINFCIGVGAYPEKHIESPNMKTDIQYLKQKIDAGADYIVTQMFFDNSKYFQFVKDCRDAGITVPIIPGIKVFNSKRHLNTLPKYFHISLPDELVDEVRENPKHAKTIGIRYGIKQCQELLEFGVPCIHFYVMNDTRAVSKIVKKLK